MKKHVGLYAFSLQGAALMLGEMGTGQLFIASQVVGQSVSVNVFVVAAVGRMCVRSKTVQEIRCHSGSHD